VPNEASVERRLAAILAADVVAYSRLMGIDEVGTLRALKAHRRELADPAVARHHGRVVKTTGDGILIEFASIVDAVTCAITIQSGMATRNATIPDERRITFRIGVNIGDIIIDEGDIYGDGVNVAARLEAICDPGGVCISRDAREQIRDKVPFTFVDLGEQAVKNIARPVRAFGLSAQAMAVLPDQNHQSSMRSAELVAAKPRPRLELPDKPSIAVLPFQNMSGDPEQEYFADGMVEDIISALSRVRGFFVIARNSSFTYKGKSVDVKQVGGELGVRYVLEGSVRRSGNKLRITAQMIDAHSNAHIWSDRYDGDLADVFDLQDRITESIIGALQPTIRSAEIERARRKRPESLDAYDLVMRALPSFWDNARETHFESVALLERAMAIDPNYALATALCAWSYAVRGIWLWTDDPARERDTALRLAKRVASLDSDDPFVLALLSAVYANTRRFSEAVPLIEKSLALDPNSAFAWHQSGWLKLYIGDPDEGITCFERAMRISPLDPYNFNAFLGIGQGHLHKERFEQGALWLTKGIAARPSATWAWRFVASAYAAIDRMDEAREALAKFTADNPDVTVSRVEKALITQNSKFRQTHLDGLRKAGLPE
jgi:adenylate cyclase